MMAATVAAIDAVLAPADTIVQGVRGFFLTLMPLYDYRCHRCGEVFEVRQKFADETLKTHDACGGDLERLISAPALQFKGTGWYVTDYGKGGKLPSKSSESKTEKPADTKVEAKSEAKSESKPVASPSPSSSDK
jgi:putative FmdB family regulatory protein